MASEKDRQAQGGEALGGQLSLEGRHSVWAIMKGVDSSVFSLRFGQ